MLIEKTRDLNAILGSQLTEIDTVIVWRGQSDVSWEPCPGIYRRLKSNGCPSVEITEDLVLSYEKDLFCEANAMGYYSDAGGNRLSLQVLLQHHGAATRFLDVTRNPLVALWFACETQCHNNGVVYRYEVAVERSADYVEAQSWNSITASKQKGRPVLYFPKILDQRIIAQQAGFLTTVLNRSLDYGSIFTDETDEIGITKYEVSSDIKPELRQLLTKNYGVNGYTLYPDFDGFARENAASREFQRDSAHLYGVGIELFPEDRWRE